MAFMNERDKYRTVDYERNIIFEMAEGTGRQFPGEPERRYFNINWDGNHVKIGTIHTIQKDDGHSLIRWRIYSCAAPQEIRDKRSELRQIIIEAFMEYGIWYGKDAGDVVEVEIDKNIESLNPNISIGPTLK